MHNSQMVLPTFSALFPLYRLRSNPFLNLSRRPVSLYGSAILLMSLILLLPATVEAQTGRQADRSDPVDEPVPSDYLERHHAARNIEKLKKSVELDIRRLGKLVRNMGKDVEGADKDYADVAAIYRKAIETYYGGDPLDAYRHLVASRARALALYKKFSEMYRAKTVEMAADLTQKVAALETGIETGTEPSQPVSSYVLYDTHHRLSVARSQIRLGDEMIRFRRPDRAIDQYRNARLITILAAYHLEPDPAKKKEILKKYEADLKDIGYHTGNLVEEIVPDQKVSP